MSRQDVGERPGRAGRRPSRGTVGRCVVAAELVTLLTLLAVWRGPLSGRSVPLPSPTLATSTTVAADTSTAPTPRAASMTVVPPAHLTPNAPSSEVVSSVGPPATAGLAAAAT